MKKNTLFWGALLCATVLGTNFVLAGIEKPHVYINPGHGGHDSDDRNVVVAPFAAGDTAGFWESNSNLKKGFALREVLLKKGYKVTMSRVKNDTEDDLKLSTIVALSNASGADVFYSIHSNATGAGDGYRVNFPMGLYRGYTGQPEIAGADSLTKCLGKELLPNKSTVWTEQAFREYGDWTFYPSWGDKVGLGVLRGNKVVSMLSEGSYHDYIPETYRLLNNNYCWVEGWNFSIATDRYFNRAQQYELGIITGNVRDDRMLRTVAYVMHGDDRRMPVNGAVVKLKNSAGDVLQTCQVDTLNNGIYLFKYLTPGNYEVEVSESSHTTLSKKVEVKANVSTYCNFDLKRVRNSAPEVTEYSPVWGDGDAPVRCNTPIVLRFNWDMDTESVEKAFTITPAVEGSFKWEDSNYCMTFTPNDAYDVNTAYTVVLGNEAQHGGGVPMQQPFSFKFKTEGRNHIAPLAVFPYEGAQVHCKAGQYVEFRTDSLLDSRGLFSLIHVYDKNGAELAYNKRSIKNNKRGDDYGYIKLPLLKALTPGQSYRLVVDKAVQDTAGLHLAEPFTCNFTAVDAGVEKEGKVVCDFEDATNFEPMLETREEAPRGECKLSSDKLFGNNSVELKYWLCNAATAPTPWQDNTLELCVMFKNFGDVTFVKGDRLGVHVNGDMSHNNLFLGFCKKDDPERFTLVPLCTLDYHGWKYETLTLDSLNEGEYQVCSFLIGNGNSKMAYGNHSIKLDNMLKLPSSGINEVHNSAVGGVTLSSTVVNDYVVAGADGPIHGVELIDSNGRVVARNATNYVNVSQLATGIYVLKVHVDAGVSSHKVVVKH